MYIFNINIPAKRLTDIELSSYAHELLIPHFRDIFMRDTLPRYPYIAECGIVNLNTSDQAGSHWVFSYRNKNDRIYFDLYSQSWKGSYTEKYRYCTSCEYTSVWSPLSIRAEITSERRTVSNDSKSYATLIFVRLL